MNIDFIWQGVTERKSHWNDGLRAAMELLETKYGVRYIEPWDEPREDAFLLYWEAPVTIQGPNSQHYLSVMQRPNKKALLFAGGPLKNEWVKGFDVVVVESEINERECDEIGVPWARAFGVNTDVFYPLDIPKQYETVTHGTCASWKRQWLVCQAMKEQALVFGQYQKTDTRPFAECEACGSDVMHEQSYEDTNKLLNKARVSVNCADFWGGGQRATLEAMACDLPVVVMTDSPKNREYVEAAGIGAVVDPNPDAIAKAVNELRDVTGGRDYVLSNWSHVHYADKLNRIIQQYA